VRFERVLHGLHVFSHLLIFFLKNTPGENFWNFFEKTASRIVSKPLKKVSGHNPTIFCKSAEIWLKRS
jgi:hypothetical protein